MKKLLVLVAVASLSGCASIKPYIVCELGTAKAQVMQGVAGIRIGQDLKDADELCSRLKPALPNPSSFITPF
jgi:uncharacterized protein YceK